MLPNVLKMQQLDAHDIEGVHPLYHALLQQQQQQQAQAPQAAQQAASPRRSPCSEQRRLVAPHSMQVRPQQPHSPLARQLLYDQQQPQQQQRPDSPPLPPSQAKEALQHMCCRRRRCSASEHLRALAECQVSTRGDGGV